MYMPSGLTIEPLALHPEAFAVLLSWYEAEWPECYGAGRGDATRDLQSFSNQGSRHMERIAHEGKALSIYEKTL